MTIAPTLERPGRAARKRRPARAVNALSTSASLTLGVSLLWFSLLVLIPLTAVVVQATTGGFEGVGKVLSNPQNWSALKLTVLEALGVTALNVVMGTTIAWVLVRDRFRGAAILDVIIDIPFALPTIVAGLVLLSLYGPHSPIGVNVASTRTAIFLALAFVTLPFVVRTVQPVLEELDTDVEEAASSLGASRLYTFRRVILPSLVPAVVAGAGMAFARGIAEYGSLVLLSGNLPNKTEVLSVRIISYIEGGNPGAASVLAAVLLLIALAVLTALDLLQRRVTKRW